jgi:hypothetical protein
MDTSFSVSFAAHDLDDYRHVHVRRDRSLHAFPSYKVTSLTGKEGFHF